MKKSSFLALVLGTLSGMLFSLGMCMTLIPEWNTLKPGIILSCVSIIPGLTAYLTWRKLEHKAPICFSSKAIGTVIAGVMGALTLGVGMCFSLVWNKMSVGIPIGLLGIFVFVCLIPFIKGIRE